MIKVAILDDFPRTIGQQKINQLVKTFLTDFELLQTSCFQLPLVLVQLVIYLTRLPGACPSNVTLLGQTMISAEKPLKIQP